MSKGDYFKVYRSLLSNDLWLKEPFTRGQAWVDLIGIANFGKTETFYKGELQIVRRGQIKASYGYFQDRWKWSRNKVMHYFKQLQVLQMVTIQGTRYGITLTLENYEFYQDKGTTKGTTKGIAESTPDGIPDGTQNKNIQRINKERGSAKLSEIVDGFAFYKDEQGNEYAEKVGGNDAIS